MKHPRLWALCFFLIVPVTISNAQSTDAPPNADTEPLPGPTWVSLQSALSTAKVTDQKVMVFIYTDWCGYCRRMNNTTFVNEDVLSYLGEKFSAVRLNAESNEKVQMEDQTVTEAQLAMALGANGFPTTVFLEANGQYITRLPGYLEPQTYVDVLRYIGDNRYRTETYEEYMSSLSGSR